MLTSHQAISIHASWSGSELNERMRWTLFLYSPASCEATTLRTVSKTERADCQREELCSMYAFASRVLMSDGSASRALSTSREARA